METTLEPKPPETEPTSAPLPPLIPRLALFGDAFAMLANPYPVFFKYFEKLGPIYRLRVPGQEFTVLGGPSAVQFVAREGTGLFSSGESWGGFAREVNVKSFLPGLDGEEHLRVRKLLKPSYSRQLIHSRLPDTVAVVDDLLGEFDTGDSIPVLRFVRRAVADQLGLISVGQRAGELFDDFLLFARTVISVTVVKKWPRVMLWRPAYRRAKKRVLAFGEDLVQKRLDNPRKDGEPDLIDDLLRAAEEHPDLVSRAQLGLGALTPFIAGLDTVSNTAAFMLFALLRNPQVLARVQAEVDEAFAEGLPAPERLRELTALRGAYLETLRFHPVAASIQRTATRSFEFEGCRVDEGATVLMINGICFRLPDLFPDPDVFDIDRFSPPRNEHKTPGAFAPYGQGNHICLGAGLADVQIPVLIATLLHRLRLEIDPPDWKLRIASNPLPTPGNRFRVKILEKRAWGLEHSCSISASRQNLEPRWRGSLSRKALSPGSWSV